MEEGLQLSPLTSEPLIDSNKAFEAPHVKEIKPASKESSPDYPGPLALSFTTMALCLSVFLVALYVLLSRHY
jgi:hypothetical protein